MSRVIKVQNVRGRGLIVHLENGQVWQQKGSGGGWRIRKGEVAVISRGSIGSYLMKAEGRNRRVSAERLK
ncbi:MAG: hypothetical protein HN816_00940 [Gammaproteobacteria bacterium]|nr:hypothetical protein [Gammaproteobacteria bacterium]